MVGVLLEVHDHSYVASYGVLLDGVAKCHLKLEGCSMLIIVRNYITSIVCCVLYRLSLLLFADYIQYFFSSYYYMSGN